MAFCLATMGLRHVTLLVALLAAADATSSGAHARLARFVAPRLPDVAPARAATRAEQSPSVWRLPARTQLAIEREVDAAIGRGDFPGCVIVAGDREHVLFRRAFGLSAVEPAREPMQADAVFDLASVTKAVVTASSVAALVDDGRLGWDDPAFRYLPELASPDQRRITLRHLLTHTSGLPADNAISDEQSGLGSAITAISRLPLLSPPGERYHYSDLGFILLGAVIERRSQQKLDTFAGARLFSPLRLDSTGFRPKSSSRLVPTEKDGEVFLRGVVHDPRARALGGVAGHAGAFSSAGDLARFSQMLLGRGTFEGVRVLGERVVREMTHPIEVDGVRVTLGWDSPDDPEVAVFSPRSFGHDGFTGTTLWIDPARDRFVVLLSSRLHPDGRGRVGPVARAIRAEIARARAVQVPVRINLGIDQLEKESFQRLAGKRLSLLTHDAARDSDGRRTTDLLFAAPSVKLVRLLAPEHGLGSNAQGPVKDGFDPRTGLPVFSLYGAERDPSAVLGDIDVVVIDLVDVGVRFFTYEATVLAVLRAASRAGKPVLLLDRPNPLGGDRVEGPLSAGPRSMVDPFSLPIRHGLTLGELARLFAGELSLSVDLEVARVQGWRRADRFDQSGLTWFPPSPNLPSLRAAELYPGVALFELTNLSVGRGTEAPFELVGAPWLDAARLATSVSGAGVRLTATSFVPRADPYRGQTCRAVRLTVTDADRFSPVEIALLLAAELRRLHPEKWEARGLDDLLHHPSVLRALESGASGNELLEAVQKDATAFRHVRERYLLYP